MESSERDAQKKWAKETWERKWNKPDYDLGWKSRTIGPTLNQLEREGKIGNVVVDVGSGSAPVSHFLRTPKKLITVDIGGDKSTGPHDMHLRYDIEHVSQPEKFDSRKALLRIAQFIDADVRSGDSEQVDTMFFSEILNYVDYKLVLSELKKYLKEGGRFIILNMPDRGLAQHFPDERAGSNRALEEFLVSEGFDIEIKNIVKEGIEEDTSMIFLVARKK